MNYKKIYQSFIENRLKNPSRNGEYFERHHIVPRSLGGNDDDENIISLSIRDHVFAHALLAKIHGGSMWYAYWMMVNGVASERAKRSGQMIRVSSRLVSMARGKVGYSISKSRSGERHHFHGKARADHVKRKISDSLSEKYKNGYVSHNKGLVRTDKQKKSFSEGMKRYYKNGGVHPMLGKKHSDESKALISKAQTGALNNNYGKALRPEHAKAIGESQLGIKNHAADIRTLVFKHISGEEYVGYRSDFIRSKKLCKGNIGRLVQGKQKKHKGWAYYGEA